MNKIDLHIHTTNSDGTFTPFEVLDMVKKNNVEIVSITDHDTIDSYTKEVFDYAKKLNIKLIPGVEISTKIEKAGIHVLGYNIDLTNEELTTKLYQLRNARHIYLHKVAEKLQKLGYKVNVEELDKIESVTKNHIAKDIVNNIENKELLLKEFNHIPVSGEFIETIMNENCKAYVRKETITPTEAANLIRQANGVVVLAHPVAYKYEDNLDEDDILELVNDMKTDGIETNYIYVDKDSNIVDEVKEWNAFARRNRLFQTVGSDFHTIDNIHPKIGLENYLKEEIIIEDLLNNLNEN